MNIAQNIGIIWFHFTINENKNSPITVRMSVCLQLCACNCCGNHEIYLKMKFHPRKKLQDNLAFMSSAPVKLVHFLLCSSFLVHQQLVWGLTTV